MKSANTSATPTEEATKAASSKNTKKSHANTKSRSKSTKNESGGGQATTSKKSSSKTSASSNSASTSSGVAKSAALSTQAASNGIAAAGIAAHATVTTPTTTNNGSGHNYADNYGATSSSSSSRSQSKSYAGFEPRSIRIAWEQHDQSDVELSLEVCTRVAEDASYKLWETIHSLKTYARHSGHEVNSDLVNEVLRNADVPPALGAMDSNWDRIDYDGSFYFYSDNIIELRDEYQREVNISITDGPDTCSSWPLLSTTIDEMINYVASLMYLTLFGDSTSVDSALSETASSPMLANCYAIIVDKILDVLAFKQHDYYSLRCWRLLRACSNNPKISGMSCREQYFHLAEVLICQLLGPFESIKVNTKEEEAAQAENSKIGSSNNVEFAAEAQTEESNSKEKIYKLQMQNDDDDVNMEESQKNYSGFFATPVDLQCLDDLCQTLGLLGSSSGYFQHECLCLIKRRLERFFAGRVIRTEKEFLYITRAVRGLTALGEYALREFIPYLYEFKPDDVVEKLWNAFVPAAIFLKGAEDIFLYEWLAHVCGADKLQPFQLYFVHYLDKLCMHNYLRRRFAYKMSPKLGVRRLEWNSLAAAMCLGDDPNKELKPKPRLEELFPECVVPNLAFNRPGTIRFKFAGCRPVIIKTKISATAASTALKFVKPSGAAAGSSTANITASPNSAFESIIAPSDILLARRKLLKSKTFEPDLPTLSSYYFLRI